MTKEYTVLTGLDRLVTSSLADRLRGFRVGLVCNAASTTKDGSPAWDALRQVGVDVVCVFAAEHGARLERQAGERFDSHDDSVIGLPVRSLYDSSRCLDSRSLEGIDLITYDLPSVGCRFYTYVHTLVELIRLSVRVGIPLLILDRPNPLRGDVVEGPLPKPGTISEFAAVSMPVRFGLTVGEVARMALSGMSAVSHVSVVLMEGWRRTMWGDETGLPWNAPSPNMRSFETMLMYPGTCLVEGTTLSEGRGTDVPFRWFGAPWLDSRSLVRMIEELDIGGLVVEERHETPVRSKHEGMTCPGVLLHVTDRDRWRPVAAMIRILAEVHRLHPDEHLWVMSSEGGEPFLDRLTGDSDLRSAIDGDLPLELVVSRYEMEARAFLTNLRTLRIHAYPEEQVSAPETFSW